MNTDAVFGGIDEVLAVAQYRDDRDTERVQEAHELCEALRVLARAIGDHREFLEETDEVFDLILNRIQDEIEQLYPLIRTIKGDAQQAA